MGPRSVAATTPGHEGPQVERGVVEHAGGLGVGGVVELEAAVEQQPVDPVGAHASADLVGGLEHDHVDAVDGQLPCRREAGQARPDDDDVVLGHD